MKAKEHFDKIAEDYDFYKEKNSFYYDNLKKLLSSLIPSGKNVLEYGCGTGDLLASLNPKVGIGYDISSEMIKIAQLKFKSKNNLKFTDKFSEVLIHKSLFINHESFIFLSDVIEHLENPEKTFREIGKLMGHDTKLIITMANPVWEPALMVAEKLGLKMPEGPHKRMAFNDLRIMIEDLGMKITKHDYKLLVPVKVPLVTDFANKYLEKPLKKLAFIEYFIVQK